VIRGFICANGPCPRDLWLNKKEDSQLAALRV
jgi:hypothetical protein